MCFTILIFQSTLPQGKWQIAFILFYVLFNFNPHFRKGSDNLDFSRFMRKEKFQSTLPQGKWLLTISKSYRIVWFQSTLPQGKWPKHLPNQSNTTYFNPHFRKGSDRNLLAFLFRRAISIHTSAREVTIHDGFVLCEDKFQSTLPQGKWHSSLLGR